MEIDWLEDFLALASGGVFSRAADARNISQSAFTRRIRNLEQWIGQPLFDRSVHPVTLTPVGESFRVTALETVNALHTARSEAHEKLQREGEVISFVALHTLAISFFPEWIAECARSLGTLRSRVVAADYSGCVEDLMTGNADFMLGYHHASIPTITDSSSYTSLEVARDTLVAVSGVHPDGSPIFDLSDPGPLPFLCYTRDSFLGRMTTHVTERAGLTERFDVICENSVAEALKSACHAGLGVAWVPKLAAADMLETGQLARISAPDQECTMQIHLYRSIERSRKMIERLWSYNASL
ncbi:LysR substrate-binding domain-containing protein [Pacificoceanicola onchidii]|uniref:LysR substrate-binding domain-containing protein n=1 Tax=Pacificoceanicola onchidii TaxID=2562685 RepID=UPI0014560659|nr:LysR substrate-binding domain-containing protein [Pacificoceanicola onchidii]